MPLSCVTNFCLTCCLHLRFILCLCLKILEEKYSNFASSWFKIKRKMISVKIVVGYLLTAPMSLPLPKNVESCEEFI